MPIRTSIKPAYLRTQLIFAIVCLVFGLWGIYDYAVKIPAKQARYDAFVQIRDRMTAIQNLKTEREAAGQRLTDAEAGEYSALEQAMTKIAPGGENPVPPSKFDAMIQWVYILCLPCVPWFIWNLVKARRHVYQLDDDGTLHLPPPREAWKPDEIKDIEMGRWMRKSIAEVVHTDGSREKLDDFIHRDMDKIVGAIAHRFYPEQWDEEARQVKVDAEGQGDADDAETESADLEAGDARTDDPDPSGDATEATRES